MQANPKKVKTIIFFCFVAIALLLVLSVVLTINIQIAKKELASQQQQIAELEQTISNYENLPGGNNSEIITQGEN